MIIASISGGLGNQLFQYSAALAKSGLDPKRVVLDLGFYELSKKTQATPRAYKLSDLGIPDLKVITLMESRITRTVAKAKSKLLSSFFPLHCYDEILESNPFRADLRILDPSSHIVFLNGYWQWREHAQHSAALMKGLLFEPTILNGRNQAIFQGTDLNDRVSIHIRRGDYADKLLVCDKNYYCRAISMIQTMLGKDLSWYVFSDDIPWARANIHPPGKTVYASDTQLRNDIDDFRAMASMKFQIISNSTFSWWSAFASCNYYVDSVILAPSLWWNSIPVANISIYPETWHVVPV